MNPEIQEKLNQLERQIQDLNNFRSQFFSAAEIDPQIARTILKIAGGLNLTDLKNVNDSGITDGQLLKYNSSNEMYEPADDIDT